MHGDAAAHRLHAIPTSALVLQFFYECYILNALAVDELTVDALTAQQSCSVVKTGRSACICAHKNKDFPVPFD